MRVEDMTIADVLKHPLYFKKLKMVIAELEATRRRAMISANAPLKRHAMDRLQEKGVFNSANMAVLYAGAMDKKLQGYSSDERKFILQVGGEAFNYTMKQLVDKENKENEKNTKKIKENC